MQHPYTIQFSIQQKRSKDPKPETEDLKITYKIVQIQSNGNRILHTHVNSVYIRHPSGVPDLLVRAGASPMLVRWKVLSSRWAQPLKRKNQSQPHSWTPPHKSRKRLTRGYKGTKLTMTKTKNKTGCCSVGVTSRGRGEHRPVSSGIIARGKYRQGSDMMK